MSESMEERTAIVTGANGAIGLAIARQLAAAGMEVVLVCRNGRKADEAVGRIKRALSDSKGSAAGWSSPPIPA